jgi:hypothetical protein
VQRATEGENVIDTKVRVQLTLVNAARIPPREAVTLGIEVGKVDDTASQLIAWVAESRGRTADQNLSHEQDGRMTARLVFEVPLAAADGLVAKFKQSGMVRAQTSSRNPQVPEGELATAKLDVTLSNAQLIVPSNEGIGAQFRTGLSASFKAISFSLIMVIVGLCVALPWALIIWGAVKLVRRMRRKPASA